MRLSGRDSVSDTVFATDVLAVPTKELLHREVLL